MTTIGCGCRLGFDCPKHESCGEDYADHDITALTPYLQNLQNGHIRRVRVYSCDACGFHDSTVYYLAQDEIDALTAQEWETMI